MGWWDAHLEEQVERLARLWRMPAWKAYAWHQAQEMARQWPDLYGGIPERVKAAVRSPSPCAPGEASTTGSTGVPGTGA